MYPFFSSAPSLAEARPLLKRVHGSRFTEKYLSARQAYNRSSYGTYGSFGAFGSGYRSTPTSPAKTPAHSPKASVSSTTGSPPASPRKVVENFAAFGAPKTASVFGTAVASTPFSLAGGKAAFGGMRSGRGGFDEDEDEDDENGPQSIKLAESAISLDQARRIALQSAWRGTRV